MHAQFAEVARPRAHARYLHPARELITCSWDPFLLSFCASARGVRLPESCNVLSAPPQSSSPTAWASA
eukprot:CAMPEP_0179134258 /NCGR_PEP_ID=MMETSP0796-20121207/63878_1 /TAXON_ID=73915 /ORGANISM="Pyrodinium bahamense, Strain pbaha01" /LENGTH=67 /DNA_ID=CAMNT_0020833245 /DNA_START=138 /DNA_END=338 /DNA_ORIENTATION=-